MSFLSALASLIRAPAPPAPPAPVIRPKPVLVQPVAGLTNPAPFYDAMRNGLLAPTLSQSEVSGLAALLTACKGLPLSWAAYALATAYHETAHTMQPIKERGGPDYFKRMYDPEGNRPHVAAALGNTEPGDGARYAGRGYVQLTGRNNYLRAGQVLGLGDTLLETPDLAMRPDLAAQIMRQGMKDGWFTGKCFNDFLPSTANEAQFVNARRIINGTDRAVAIADYALRFQDALKAGAWA